MIQRILFFVILIALVTFLPTWLFAIALIAYAFRFTAYELIFLGMCIDGLYGFGHPSLLPYYTLSIAVGLIFIEWIKPKLSVYNDLNVV